MAVFLGNCDRDVQSNSGGVPVESQRINKRDAFERHGSGHGVK
jgi:hypothetical protein